MMLPPGFVIFSVGEKMRSGKSYAPLVDEPGRPQHQKLARLQTL